MASELQVADDQHRPTQPCLKPALRSLLDRAHESRLSFDGPTFHRISADWRQRDRDGELPRISAEGREIVATALAKYEAYLKPAPRGKLSARVTILLSHYFVPDLPVAAQTAVIEDWVAALAEFPWWAIEQACGEWLRTQRRKPTPADIVDICGAVVSSAQVDVYALTRMLKAPTRERAA